MAKINREYLRSVVFGIEDSLVSTTGLIAGISVGADNKQIVLLGGIVAIAIESVSMGVGEYLSDDAVQDFDNAKKRPDSPALSGVYMLVSYFLAGMIPLLPIVILDYPNSVIVSVVAALIGLFMLGFLKGKLIKRSPWKGALKILIAGGIATALGVAVGLLFKVQ